MYGIFSSLAFLFTYSFIAETKGLTDKEKKELYIPGAKWGRALRAGEEYNRRPTAVSVATEMVKTWAIYIWILSIFT